ncbi:IS110 family transposase [Chondrinema litorale]|uniref:IS110 family transposase n=1 Tax=Chondrinema litorale TaxID=2994555 RepID=UPI002542C6D2|nr:IS110 family transposase [Chondrinema litorale]UZR99833.1 IS110 family transposase [Chondrinema litorale]UZS00301.1 IS110 family transposase [Chondrinema litorale]
MKIMHSVGIDVSKKSFDVSISKEGHLFYLGSYTNSKKDIVVFIKDMKGQGLLPKNTLLCIEHTGIYTQLLLEILYGKKWQVWLEQPINIKKSLGNRRGKNDRIDSLRIAEYAQRFQDKAILWRAPRKQMVKLRQLVSVRARLLKAKQMISVPATELCSILDKDTKAINTKVIQELANQIKKVEAMIDALIKDDGNLKRLHDIIVSVAGVGKVTSWQMLVYTNEFKDFDNAKKFACYCGVVPFEHSSGSSIYTKPRVSNQANKKMKELLHMSALSATQMKGELNDYYLKKVGEGKKKMLVLNNIRNKLIHRIFKCIKEDRKYEKNYRFILV